MPSVCYVTLGCAKNEVDTDRMRALLRTSGYSDTTDATKADVVLVNTCSFLASATSESIETTLQLAETVYSGVREKPIIMCGCVPSRYGEALPKALPEVAAFVRADEEDGIVDVVSSVLGIEQRSSMPDLSELTLRTVEGPSAFVKISDGCNRFCSFCAIPFIRGHYASRTAVEILAEVRMLMQGGVREIILIGQDTGVWGCDFGDGHDLAWLLHQVAAEVRPYHGWIRILYLQPEGMSDDLIAAIRDLDEVLPYIDIPIQHCSESVLKAMNRKGDAQQFREVFARLRNEIPHMVLRTTALCGFPGETDEDFDELMDFLREQEFDYTSVFSYSPEEGTRGARMPNQVDEATKLDRTQALVDLAEQLGFAATAKHVGEVVDVIVDAVEKPDEFGDFPGDTTNNGGGQARGFIGHAWFQAPDCDGVVHIRPTSSANTSIKVGDIVRCKLIDSFCYELVGEIVTHA